MQIVILCGGLGTRLKSISGNLPKGLLTFNKKPFMDYLLAEVNKFSPSSLHFCLGYKSDLYLKYISNLKISCNVTFSIEEESNLLGTGGAIKNAISYLNENFILQYGDSILKIDYSKFFSYHLSTNNPMTMSVMASNLGDEQPNSYCFYENDNLCCIYNKKEIPQNANYIDYGAIAFQKKLFDQFPKNKFDLSELQTLLSLNKKASFFNVTTPYIEIGNSSSYSKANSILD